MKIHQISDAQLTAYRKAHYWRGGIVIGSLVFLVMSLALGIFIKITARHLWQQVEDEARATNYYYQLSQQK